MNDASEVPSDLPPVSASPFSAWRVARIVVPLIAVAGGAVYYFGFLDGVEQVARWLKPPRVPVTGIVTLDGRPLSGAQIQTRMIDSNLAGAIGFSDENGEFKLMMDIDGKWEDGAYVGRHQVSVVAFNPQAPASAPQMRSPAKYASFSKSPLRITVDRDPSKNRITLDLTGGPGKDEANASSPREDSDRRDGARSSRTSAKQAPAGE